MRENYPYILSQEDQTMDMNSDLYKKYVTARAPKSGILKDCTWAFLIGGTICFLAEALRTFYIQSLGIAERDAGTLTSISIIGIAIFLTAIGVFDKIARHAGAGTLVPITGFANAVSSPAIDSRSEGLILGVGAKIFTVAGPVLLYGILSGAVYGVIYRVIRLVTAS